MKSSSALCAALATLLILFPMGFVDAGAAEQSVIRVKGSNPMAGIIDRLAGLYMKENKDCTIVVSGGGTALGLEELCGGNAEIAMGSRAATPDEKSAAEKKGLNLSDRLIGWDGVAVVAHPSNPVDELSFDQIRRIFSGEYEDWSRVGGRTHPIKVFAVDVAKAAYAGFFHDYLLKKTPLRNDAENRRFFPSVVKEVAKSVDAVGYAPLRMVLVGDAAGSVKAIAVKKTADSEAVAASIENLDLRSYPLILPLFLYYDAAAKDKHIKGFVEFCYTKGASIK